MDIHSAHLTLRMLKVYCLPHAMQGPLATSVSNNSLGTLAKQPMFTHYQYTTQLYSTCRNKCVYTAHEVTPEK